MEEDKNNPRAVLFRRKDILETYIQELERQIDNCKEDGTACADLISRRRDTLEIRLNEVIFLITNIFK